MGKKIYESRNGNYELYKTKKHNSVIKGENVFYQKISPVKYKILIKNLKNSQELVFNDSIQGGWKLYLDSSPDMGWCDNPRVLDPVLNTAECIEKKKIFDLEDLTYIFRQPMFANSQTLYNGFANKWTVTRNVITDIQNNKSFTKNSDGTIDVELTLYYLPQNYFYYGALISLLVLLSGLAYVVYEEKRK